MESSRQRRFHAAPSSGSEIAWIRNSLGNNCRNYSLCTRRLVRRYTFLTAAGTNLLCWDGGRLMNHSCQPSCAGTHLGFEVAIRDLEPGAELTNDYATLSLTEEEFFPVTAIARSAEA